MILNLHPANLQLETSNWTSISFEKYASFFSFFINTEKAVAIVEGLHKIRNDIVSLRHF